MATLTANESGRTANAITADTPEIGGDQFANTGVEVLLVRHTNSGGSSVTLSVPIPKQVDGEAVDDKEIVIGAGETHLVGPFPRETYNNGDGNVSLEWDSVTDLEVMLLRKA
ncbi:MAG: hypothetical protein GVY28_12515 [Alphaproteobacteria bacterium]|jgi:hypothetical protein|nr:hypothetical protein [Alphaproteobacteria bacterium]